MRRTIGTHKGKIYNRKVINDETNHTNIRSSNDKKWRDVFYPSLAFDFLDGPRAHTVLPSLLIPLPGSCL